MLWFPTHSLRIHHRLDKVPHLCLITKVSLARRLTRESIALNLSISAQHATALTS